MSIGNRIATQRGVTLIEALVAMAVMAFGMLALVGVQSTLRVNADLAKQRAEATRIAEQQLEQVRGFVTVGMAPGPSEFDSLASTPAETVLPPERNTEYLRTLTIMPQADGLQQTVMVTVTWKDRYDNERQVVLRDLVARASPALSGLVSSVRSVTVAGQRNNRHPTIPVRAGDLGNNESGFKPTEGGSTAWVFNNTTGVITRVCVVPTSTLSNELVEGDLSACSNTNAQLLAGYIRFNLRGVSKNLGDGTSVYKPVASDTVAWVINNSTSSVIRSCLVSAGSTTASLTSTDVPAACTTVNPSVNQLIATFDASDSPTYPLTAADAEDPRWPALAVDVNLALSSTGHSSATACFTDAPSTSVGANAQYAVQYFCIIYPNSKQSWTGRSTLVPMPFTDGNSSLWSIGTATSTYRVCRYTTAGTAYTDNLDHPADYGTWVASCGVSAANPPCRPISGNLINQNFLVIEGSKSCPTDVAANPASGDLVNTNTLQHQP